MKRIVTGLCAVLSAVNMTARAEWYEDMKIKGDLRYRFEHIDEEGKDARQRDRIRARIGAFPKINDEIEAGFQLTTGGEKGNKTDPVSGNASLTDVFSKKGIYLDLAYFAWRPELVKGVTFSGGKMKNPFVCVGDYIWDGDATPEGLALNYKLGDDIQLLANAGYLWLYERSASDDNRLYGGQMAMRFKASEKSYVLGGCSYYFFDNIKGQKATELNWEGAASGYGNSLDKVVDGTTTNSLYANDFRSVEPFIEGGFDIGLPVKVYGSYVVNTEADDNKSGYMGGLTLGKAKDPGSFELDYNYRRLEKDAWLGALADSDSWGGGTDGKGHKLSAKYQILKNWQAGITYFIDDKKIDDSASYKRLQIDLAAKF